ncbi:MAG TPA: glucose-6-phosphate isomerase [Xanthobacteraceae bacterium]|nr:glucose-6-phosphate isomerase [Xanthobacteraceae bacterium]
MRYTHSIERAFRSRIGEGGLDDQAFARALAHAEGELENLRNAHKSGSLPLLRLPEKTDDFAALKQAVKQFAKASDIVFFGTGGSSLGGQTLAQLADYAVPGLGALREKPRVHFFDNLDPITFEEFLKRVPLKTTRFVSISKSGGTGETLMQTIAAIEALKRAKLEKRLPDHLIGLSEPARPGKRNGLRELMQGYGCLVLDHDPGVGGRYSVLSNVGLLPALALGLDAKAIRAGAREALAPLLAGKPAKEFPPAVGAALSVTASEGGKPIAVTMAYADRLERFAKWWVQLWAESLGKAGKGTTPVAALGPVDQHSQLQLYLAGPGDKLFTVITAGVGGRGPRMDAALSKIAGEPEFAGRRIGDLVAAQGRATADTLAKNGRPVRVIHIEELDERTLGALLMHFMLETIIAARLLGVDPFDQPAVEEGKILAKKYLAGK